MFSTFRDLVAKNLDRMSQHKLLATNYDNNKIWDIYLNAFPEETRQEHNCNCCKAFIRQIGFVVAITPELEVLTIWDGTMPKEYAASAQAVREYVLSLNITDAYRHCEGSTAVGVKENWSEKHQVRFSHFRVQGLRYTFGPGDLASTAALLQRGVTEITADALDTVLEIIKDGSLYRGNEVAGNISKLRDARTRYQSLPETKKNAYIWRASIDLPPSVTRLKNTSVGTLLMDLSEGKPLEASVAAYERMVAPSNYRRPTALVTPRMIEEAKKTLEKEGLMSALERRRLDTRDLGPHNSLFVYRSTTATSGMDAFASLTGEAAAGPPPMQTLNKCEEIGIEKFISDVLPNAKKVRVLVENRHLPRFVTLTGPVDKESPTIFKWDSAFGWDYTGGVADAIKERVKAAGGATTGWLRISLAWFNHDDLDLALMKDGAKKNLVDCVYFGNKKVKYGTATATLDVDMNAGSGTTRTPVENIIIDKPLPPGKYTIRVNNYCARDSRDKGFTLQTEFAGNIQEHSSAKSPGDDKNVYFNFTVTSASEVKFDDSLKGSMSQQTKWGVTTNTWRNVSAITLSPNHWDKPDGLKHYMFLLEGCVSDERTRPFYNEFLKSDLNKHRKVMEMLAPKCEVANAEGAELSGIGISDTNHDHVFVEVESKFKRILKVRI